MAGRAPELRSGDCLSPDAPMPPARAAAARANGRVGQQGSHGAGGRHARGRHTLPEPVVGPEHQEERGPRVCEPGPSPAPAPTASTAPAPPGIQTPFCGRPRHGGACRGGRAAAQAAAPPRIATFPMLRHDGGASGGRGGASGTSSDDVYPARPPPLPRYIHILAGSPLFMLKPSFLEDVCSSRYAGDRAGTDCHRNILTQDHFGLPQPD